jgi:hypothetical protein
VEPEVGARAADERVEVVGLVKVGRGEDEGGAAGAKRSVEADTDEAELGGDVDPVRSRLGLDLGDRPPEPPTSVLGIQQRRRDPGHLEGIDLGGVAPDGCVRDAQLVRGKQLGHHALLQPRDRVPGVQRLPGGRQRRSQNVEATHMADAQTRSGLAAISAGRSDSTRYGGGLARKTFGSLRRVSGHEKQQAMTYAIEARPRVCG